MANEEEIDYENMTDEELDSYLDNMEEEENLDDNSGEEAEEDSHEDQDGESQDEGEADAESEDPEADNEDTDTGSEELDEEQTENDSGEGDQESSEEGNEEQDENTQDEDFTNNSADEEESDSTADDASKGTTLSQEDFDKYKNFYEIVTSDFKANGKTVKGITDPKKVVMNNQKAYGVEEKFKALKQVRPKTSAMDKRGLLDDENFNLMMSIWDGDPEAIKAHLKSKELDPFELEMDEIKYSNQNQMATQRELGIEDTLMMAKNYGVEDKVSKVFGEEWDDVGFDKIIKNPGARAIIMEHMTDGRYAEVTDKISELSRIDVNGSFDAMDSYDKYDYAMKAIAEERRNAQEPVSQNRLNEEKVNEEKRKIAEKQEQSEYQNKLEIKKRKADEERKKATSLSGKKTSRTPKKKEIDVLKLSDEDLDNMLNSWG